MKLEWWSPSTGCKGRREEDQEVWIRVVGLPLHLWTDQILEKIGNGCGGYIALDKDTAQRNDLRWARILVKKDRTRKPSSANLLAGARSYELQIWWELQPRVMEVYPRGCRNKNFLMTSSGEDEGKTRAPGRVKEVKENRSHYTRERQYGEGQWEVLEKSGRGGVMPQRSKHVGSDKVGNKRSVRFQKNMGIKEREEGAKLVISRDIDQGGLGLQTGKMGDQYQRSYIGITVGQSQLKEQMKGSTSENVTGVERAKGTGLEGGNCLLLLQRNKAKAGDEKNGEKGKTMAVGGQKDGMLHWEGQKLKQTVAQKEWTASSSCRMGPTNMVQVRSRVREGNNGLWEFGGVKPKAIRAHAKQIRPLSPRQTDPAAKKLSPVQIGLSENPAAKKLSPVQIGLSENPAEKYVYVEQQSCNISPEWKTMMQSSEVTPINNWKEGGRRVDQDIIPLLENDVSRYVKPALEDYPSSKISVFGRPLLMGGSSNLEDPLKLKEIDDSVPLRMVAADGREWGLESSDALEVIEEGACGEGQQEEELFSGESGGSSYENWEDSCLFKFSEFLGFSTVGFESEILGLLRRIVARQHQGKNKGAVIMSRCERELKKLVCTINYDGRSQIKGGHKERGSIMLRS